MKKTLLIFALLFLTHHEVGISSASFFTDVDVTNPHAQAINDLKTNGIVSGYADGTFRPDNLINRAEFTKIVVGAVTAHPTGSNCFPDVTDEWFAPYVCYAKTNGMISGYADGTFHPAQNINLAESLKIILNALHVNLTGSQGNNWYDVYVNTAIQNGYLSNVNSTVAHFITRGEMAQLIYTIQSNTNGNANLNTNNNAPLPTATQIQISNFTFSPSTITVSAGSTITWTNNDAMAHTVTGSNFSSGTLNTGQTFSHTFDTSGTFDYHCAIHPSMLGTVVVTPSK